MKKLLLTFVFAISLGLGLQAQEYNKKERLFTYDNIEYVIIVKEKFGYKYYRMTLFNDGKFYDLVWTKKVVYITELKY